MEETVDFGASYGVGTNSGPRIGLIATLDSKEGEALILAKRIQDHGGVPILFDTSLGPKGSTAAYDGVLVSREQLAKEADTTVSELVALGRTEAMPIVAKAASGIISRMITEGHIAAVVGVGGGTGAWLSHDILQKLPFGFPKLVVSTAYGKDASYDIMALPSVADIAGMNRVLQTVFTNAAAAICGMARAIPAQNEAQRPTVAVSMFGVTTKGANYLRQNLEARGFEVITFHSNGTGGRTMERLIADGEISALVDWTTTEVTDQVVGGGCSAGDKRMDAAAAAGIPQIVVPGATDIINFIHKVPEGFENRLVHWHSPVAALVRTSVAESDAIGHWMASKLNRSTGNVKIIVPTEGYSAIDREGEVFYSPEADAAWVRGLKNELRSDIPVVEAPLHINDEAFAALVADALVQLIEDQSSAAVQNPAVTVGN